MSKSTPMRDAFLEALHARMLADETIILLSADFGSPVLDKIRSTRPTQFINVGIAEQNLVNVATGLGLEGYKVFCYAIAPFITMRCFEQIRVNLALLSQVRELNVNLIGVGAGYSYVVSGPTHQCYEDLSIMRSLPSISIISPSDEIGASELVDYALAHRGPKYVRFDAQPLPKLSDKKSVTTGYRILENGRDLTIVATGFMTHTAIKVGSRLNNELGVQSQIIDLCRLDGDVDLQALLESSRVVTLEEAFIDRGGLDAFVRSRLSNPSSILSIGVRPAYEFALGSREHLHERVGIGELAVFEKITGWLG
jgi:transketolase